MTEAENKLKNGTAGNTNKEKELQAEINRLNLIILQLNADVKSRQNSLDDLKEAYDKLENSNTEMAGRIKIMQAELDSLKNQINALRLQLKECQEASGK